MPEGEIFWGAGSKGCADSAPLVEVGLTDLQNIGGATAVRFPPPPQFRHHCHVFRSERPLISSNLEELFALSLEALLLFYAFASCFCYFTLTSVSIRDWYLNTC